jgi:hypothetical protein
MGWANPESNYIAFTFKHSVINGSVSRIERRRRFAMKCDLSHSTSTKHRKAPYDRISALNDFICLCEKEARPDIVQNRMIEGRCVLSRKGNVVVLCSVFTSISEL